MFSGLPSLLNEIMYYVTPLQSFFWRKQLQNGKIGYVASKGCDLRKIPLKDFGLVKYYWKLPLRTENTILSVFSSWAVKWDQNTPNSIERECITSAHSNRLNQHKWTAGSIHINNTYMQIHPTPFYHLTHTQVQSFQHITTVIAAHYIHGNTSIVLNMHPTLNKSANTQRSNNTNTI